ncbi:MAG: hypothetical protein K6G37_03055 [Bacilli bacterium]|nr:hypothetical protein [Bacilli bacterium]
MLKHISYLYDYKNKFNNINHNLYFDFINNDHSNYIFDGEENTDKCVKEPVFKGKR